MSTETIFETTAASQGWTPVTQVSVLLNYIANQNSPAAFADFLAEQADEENSYNSDVTTAAIERPTPPPASPLLFFIVTGRKHGADEDTCEILEAADRADAIEEFKRALLDDDYVADSSPYETSGDYSRTVYVNTVLSCDTRPRDAS